MIESLQSARLVEHNIIGEFFIGMVIWVSCHCIHQAYCQLYIFCLRKINKNRNTEVCLTIPLNKKPLYTETRQSICIANQSTGFYTARALAERIFGQTTAYIQNTKYNSLSPWYNFSLHFSVIIGFDVRIYSLIQISYSTKIYHGGIEPCKPFLLSTICNNFLPFYF